MNIADRLAIAGSGKIWPRAVLLVVLAALAGGVAAAYARGSSYDEYWSTYFSNPAVRLSGLWAHLAPSETDPPYFYILARFWQSAAGTSLFAQRMVNLAPLLFLLAWFGVTARRHEAQRPFLTGLALLAFTGKFFLAHFPEDRGYFFQYSAELVFLGAAGIAYLENDRRVDFWQLAAIPFLFTLHLVTALCAAIMFVPFLLVDLRRGHFWRAACIACVSAVSVIPLGLIIAWPQHHAPLLSAISVMPWITPRGPLNAAWTLLSHLPPDLGENWVAFGIVVMLLCRPAFRPAGIAVGLIRLIGMATLVEMGVILAINVRSPLIVDRYFSCIAVELMVMLVLAIMPVLRMRPLLAVLVLGNAVIYGVYGGMAVALSQGWRPDGQIVAQLAAQCPSTRIHAGSAPADGAEQVGLAEIAASYHLTLLPLGPDTPGACPVLYWTEYRAPKRAALARFGGDMVRAANVSAGFGLSAAALAHAQAVKTHYGVVLVVRPAQAVGLRVFAAGNAGFIGLPP